MFFLIISLVFFSASIIEDPLERDCLNDNYTTNSIFETNLKQVLNTLPSLTSPTGFNNHSEGESPNKVYGQALCRGDVNSNLCQDCVQKASQEILKCGTKEAIIWYQLCQAHYSFQNFFGYSVYTGKFPKWNNQEKNMYHPLNFKKHVGDLLYELSKKAVSKPDMKLFATGKVKFSKDGTVYALVQCTRDISASDCQNCLQSASKELIDQEKEGGIVLSRNCNVRFELNCFFCVPGHGNSKTRIIAFVISTTIIVILVHVFCLLWKRGKAKDDEKQQKALSLQEMEVSRLVTMTQKHDIASIDELPYIDLANVRAATCNFSDENKLGRGGFGIVYKGVLPDGKEVAVKRLSGKSWQGLEEFKNEVLLIAKLQHRNLVRLMGYGMEEEEKWLIYEFMPNKSLDTFIFDSEKRAALNWKICYNIIRGIARGLLYLHEDSRLKIIHRDLKPGNILLDNDMVAKISDFGMARIFGEDQNTANTKRVRGTYGYIAPEYAMDGLFSAKSDVFSFGVIVLEIISGKKNGGFYLTKHAQSLLTYAWRLWNEGKQLELADSLLMETSTVSEVLRCIHIGLLCVQEDPNDRPPMSSVVSLLGSEQAVLPQPKQPAFSVSKILSMDQSSSDPSSNHVTVSCISPR